MRRQKKSGTGCLDGASADQDSASPSGPKAKEPNLAPTLEDSSSFGVVDFRHAKLNFVITADPSAQTLENYVKDLKKLNVQTVVRCSAKKSTVSDEKMTQQFGGAFKVYGLDFFDGNGAPSHGVVEEWLAIVRQHMEVCDRRQHDHYDEQTPCRIAVHCRTGLGRAPIMVALALMKLGGLSGMRAIQKVRAQRSEAFNGRQINFLIAHDGQRSRRQQNTTRLPEEDFEGSNLDQYLKKILGKKWRSEPPGCHFQTDRRCVWASPVCGETSCSFSAAPSCL